MTSPFSPGWGTRTFVMGVINVTPDSFSGDGLFRDVDAVTRRAQKLVAAGADILDVGGESTRPGYVAVPVEEELRRVIPAIHSLKDKVSVPVSIDTRKAEVARQAVAAGACIVNDVSGFGDPDMPHVVRESGASIVIVHHGRPPQEDIVAGIAASLTNHLMVAEEVGIPREAILLDPGLGMGKGWRDNLAVMRGLKRLTSLAFPLLLGPSRKGMISKVLGVDRDDRLEGTVALVALCIANGADVVRVHDVEQMTRVARMMDALVRAVPAMPRY